MCFECGLATTERDNSINETTALGNSTLAQPTFITSRPKFIAESKQSRQIGGGVSGAGEFRGTSEVQGAMQGAVGSGKGALDQALQASSREQSGGKGAGGGGGGGQTTINAQGQNESLVSGSSKRSDRT